ncbi:ribbon-helix-helix domain-containing protein [Sphingorhabdus sp. EL138]|uniref:ribbon-helix-helix domain-containing protein n=1 Tax=Sphingorhabdus sp. EL138 TaxID=2073156 RepID=UPI0020B12447|nr:ribbon-helix-helix domain-containing protein [Sphingorhabdus sp. EL138]
MATNTQPTTAMLSIRLDTATLAALDSLAVGRGGRSAIMRQMIEQMLEENSGRPLIDRPGGAAGNRVSLRFTDAEIAVIEYRASQRSTNRSGWIKALVRRHLALKSRVDDGLLNELAPIRMQLLRIGRNLNQAMKAANLRMMDNGDKKIENDLRRIADMRMEISEQVAAVGEAMQGDASYWTVAD